MTYGIERGAFEMGAKPPGIERPKTISELAPSFERIHDDAVQRVRKLNAADLDRELIVFHQQPSNDPASSMDDAVASPDSSSRATIGVGRLAGGVAPSPYGPNREEMAKLRQKW